jgi:hypothetical protein
MPFLGMRRDSSFGHQDAPANQALCNSGLSATNLPYSAALVAKVFDRPTCFAECRKLIQSIGMRRAALIDRWNGASNQRRFNVVRFVAPYG